MTDIREYLGSASVMETITATILRHADQQAGELVFTGDSFQLAVAIVMALDMQVAEEERTP